jgi:hypothetical protein
VSTYTPQTWVNEPTETTKINATRLGVIETGIATRVGSVDGVDPDGTGNVNVANATTTSTGKVQLAGDLTGTATAPTLRTTLNDPAAATPGLRTLGTSATQACAGNDSRLSNSRAPTGSAGGSLSGTYPNPGLAVVPTPPVTLTYAASLTPVATDGNYRVCTMTGDATLNAPSSPTDGQLLRIRFIASGAQRIVTFAAAIKRTDPLASTLTVLSGKRGDVTLLYESADSAWTLLTATRQA